MRVVVADTEPSSRQEIVEVLSSANATVVGEATSATELLGLVSSLRPDAVVVDSDVLHMVRTTSVEIAGVPVLEVTRDLRTHDAVELFGQSDPLIGYLNRERIFDDHVLAAALTLLKTGRPVIDPGVVARMLLQRRQSESVDTLTAREREVMTHVADGLSEKATAKRLTIGDHTVRTHLRRSFQKCAAITSPHLQRQVQAVLELLKV